MSILAVANRKERIKMDFCMVFILTVSLKVINWSVYGAKVMITE